MRIHDRGPRSQYEEALRSLGLLLDAEGFRHVVLVETDAGFLVTGLRFATDQTRAGGGVGALEFVSAHFSDEEVAAMLDVAYAHRGGTHRAVHYERVLRIVGRWIDSVPGSRVTIVDQGGTLLARVLPPIPAHPPFVMAEFTAEHIEALSGDHEQERKRGSRWGRSR